MKQILDAILSGSATADDFAAIPIPGSYRAVTVHKDEEQIFAGLPSKEKDPRKSLHVEDVPLPELGPGEALVAVMASSINYNTVWTSIFEPVSTFGFLERYGRTNPLAKRHDLPYHVIGSDLSGVGTCSTCSDRRGSLSRLATPSNIDCSSLWTVTAV